MACSKPPEIEICCMFLILDSEHAKFDGELDNNFTANANCSLVFCTLSKTL